MMAGDNQYVLITGATAGISYELTKIFARKGYNLILVSDDEATLGRIAEELAFYEVKIITLVKDLFQREQAFSLCDEITKLGIQIDILVNDAGQSVFHRFEDTDSERELDEINLNISSFVILTKCFIKEMTIRKNGKILSIASVAGKFPSQWYALSHKTEAFVVNYIASVRNQLLGSNVSLTVLVPEKPENNFVTYIDMLPEDNVKVKGNQSDFSIMAKDAFRGMMLNEDIVVSGVSPGHMILSRQKNQPYLDGHQGPYEES